MWINGPWNEGQRSPIWHWYSSIFLIYMKSMIHQPLLILETLIFLHFSHVYVQWSQSDLNIQRTNITQVHHLNKCSKPPIPDSSYQFSSLSVLEKMDYKRSYHIGVWWPFWSMDQKRLTKFRFFSSLNGLDEIGLISRPLYSWINLVNIGWNLTSSFRVNDRETNVNGYPFTLKLI